MFHKARFAKECAQAGSPDLAERGTGADAGRHRLSFLSADRRFRVVIDDRTGEIIQRSSIAFEGSSLPESARRPGR